MPIFNVSSEINCTTEFVLGMAFVFRTATESCEGHKDFSKIIVDRIPRVRFSFDDLNHSSSM